MNRIGQEKLFRHRFKSALFYWLFLPGLVFGSGLVLDTVLNLPHWSHGLIATVAALIVLACGIALIAWSEYDLKHFGLGTSSPAMPTRRLVTTGSYKLCRHPMFLGYDLAASAILFITGSPAMIMISFPIMLIWQTRFLRKEEKILASRFGKEYASYRNNVSFLIPFLPPSRR